MAYLKHDGASRFTFCVPRVEVEERGDCQRIAADRTRTNDESPLCRASYVHVPCAQQRFPDSSVPQRQSLEHVMYSLDISRVYYAVSSQVSALILLSLLSTTAVDNADEEGQLMKSLKADIANAHEHPRTVLTESFGIACFTIAGCTGAAKRDDAVATDEAGTPQPFQPTRAPSRFPRANTHTLARWVLETRPL